MTRRTLAADRNAKVRLGRLGAVVGDKGPASTRKRVSTTREPGGIMSTVGGYFMN